MPWWAYLYLALLLLATIGGISDDMRRPYKEFFISCELVSAVFVVFFMTAYFHASVAAMLGASIFVMFALGMVYEFISAHRTLSEHDRNPDPELTPREAVVLKNLGLILGNLFIVPGYVFGLMAGLRYAGV